MELTDREHDVVTSVWGEDIPRNLGDVSRRQLVAMHDRISQAVQTAYVDNDEESLTVLLPIERKLVTVLHDRL
jgi:hypothetical protein